MALVFSKSIDSTGVLWIYFTCVATAECSSSHNMHETPIARKSCELWLWSSQCGNVDRSFSMQRRRCMPLIDQYTIELELGPLDAFKMFMVDTRAYDTGPTYLELASRYLRGSISTRQRAIRSNRDIASEVVRLFCDLQHSTA
jgi:hypothetical protein